MSVLAKQSLHTGDESSDVSVDENSPLLELLQKLKKVDPDALILNFSQSDDPELEDDSAAASMRGEDDEETKIAGQKEREDYFVFAAFVPPGKHMLVLRDTGTFAHKKQQKQVKFDNERVSPKAVKGINTPSRMHSDSSLEAEDEFFSRKEDYGLKRTGQGAGSSSLLMGHISEDKSEYYFKELLVEPRQNPVMATHSKPFTFEYSPMKVLNKKS